MKSGGTFQISSAFWKKEAPDLGRVGAEMEKAIDAVVKAYGAAKPGDASGIQKAETALDELEKVAKKAASEAAALEKKEKDAKAKKALRNCADALGKPLAAEIMQHRNVLEDLGEGDDEADDSAFGDADAHGKYLKKVMAKVKKNPYSFALILPSNEPGDMRFNFHRKKGGRALGAQLKKATGGRKFTFGTAGGKAFGDEQGEEGISARTLVLDIQGKKIPGLAKRAKLALRLLKVTAFSKVIITAGGVPIEEADDDTDLTALDPVDLAGDLDEEDETSEAAAAAAPPPPPPPAGAPASAEEQRAQETSSAAPEIAAQLKRRLAALQPGLKDAPAAVGQKLMPVAKAALERIRGGDYAGATKAIEALEAQLGKLGLAPETPEAAPAAPPPPPLDAAAIEKALAAVLKRVQGIDDKTAVAPLVGRAREIQALLREGQLQDANTGVRDLAEAVEAVLSGTGPETGGGALAIWRETKEQVDTGISQLQTALTGHGHPDLQRIADFGLNGAVEGNNVKLMAALMSYERATGEARAAAAEAVRKEAAAYRSFLASSELASLCENNPFGVSVQIRQPLSGALDRIEELVAG